MTVHSGAPPVSRTTRWTSSHPGPRVVPARAVPTVSRQSIFSTSMAAEGRSSYRSSETKRASSRVGSPLTGVGVVIAVHLLDKVMIVRVSWHLGSHRPKTCICKALCMNERNLVNSGASGYTGAEAGDGGREIWMRNSLVMCSSLYGRRWRQ